MSDGLKTFLIVVVILLLLSFVGIGLKIVFFAPHVIDKSIDTAYGVTDKTMTAENAIYNYEWFKMQEESILALYKKEERAKQDVENYIKTLPENKEKWTREDKNELSRLQSVVSGLGNMTDDTIAEYNAKSKMVNRAIFKDNLPSNISRAIISGMNLIKN